MLNMLRALMDKEDSIQEQMSSVSREIEILRKNQKKKKNTRDQNNVTEIKNDFDGLISRLNIAEERISEIQDIYQQILQKLKNKENKD